MGLSSNTLVHFTAKKAALLGILADNFRLKYCKETMAWGNADETSTIYVPMVSFCDIPLSQVKEHIAHYGHYGIGLSRTWAIRNRLNPVVYVQSGSELADSYKAILKMIAESKGTSQIKESLRQVLSVFRYTKNYEGLLARGELSHPRYRFSDEREWRYVPPVSAGCEMLYLKHEFLEDEAQRKAAESVADMRLTFTPDDVKWIIIRSDDEISEFIDHLRKAKGKTYTQHDIERLTTRLLTSEQIHQDI